MIKLFSLFVRYARLPEKEFNRLASAQIFKLAEFVERYEEKNVQISSSSSSLLIKRKNHTINIEAQPNSRQLFYRSSISPTLRFDYLGSKWQASQNS